MGKHSEEKDIQINKVDEQLEDVINLFLIGKRISVYRIFLSNIKWLYTDN